MKKTLLYSISAITLLFYAGCKKDLNIKNPNQPTTDVFWKTASDAQQGVNAIYSTLHRAPLSRWIFFLSMIRSDEGTSLSPNANLVNNFDKFIVTNYNNGETVGVWNDSYVGINRANQVLDNVPGIPMDAALRSRLVAEAKFLRAYYYFTLAVYWGNVPLMLKTPTPQDLPETTPREQIWAQVAKDLTEAIPDLPLAYTGNDLGRVTKGAANALLAKAYMQQRKFNEALAPLLAVIQSNTYDLTASYADNFSAATENNRESVFEIQFASNALNNHDDDTDINQPDNLNYGSSIPPFFAPKPIGFTDGQARRWLVNEFSKEKTESGGRDNRVATSFLYDSTDVRGPVSTLIYGQTFRQRYGAAGTSDVWFRKFLNDNNGTATSENFRSPNNYRVIRFADVLLLYAEALNETGGTTQAYPYIDRVRQRAGMPTLTSAKPGLSQAAMRDQIKHERIVELSGEGHRWEDLARWNDLSPQLAGRDPGFANFQTGKHELLPIPQQDIDINTKLKQNPGW